MSQFPTRVLLLLFMDHSYNNNNKWRLHAIFSDPRVWINRGSTMDQHGSTWINRLQPAAVLTHGSCVMAHASGVESVQRPDSCVLTHGSWLMRPDSWLMAHASGVLDSWLMAHASGVRRQASGVRRQASIQSPPPVVGHDDNRNGGIFPILSPQICAH